MEVSSGNVFADIGMKNPEAALVKAEIARRVNAFLNVRELTQKQAAKLLGIPQSRISYLLRGRLTEYSLERMIDLAKRVGNDVEISIKPSKKPRFKLIQNERRKTA